MVERDGGFRESAAMVRIHDAGRRSFGVVEGIRATTGFGENREEIQFGPVWADEHRPGLVLKIERRCLAAAVDGLPTALVARPGAGFAVAVGVVLGHGAGPVLLNRPAVVDALGGGEMAGEGGFGFSRAFEFDQTDEHAGGFGCWQVLEQPLALVGAQSRHHREQAEQTADPGNERCEIVHWSRRSVWPGRVPRC